MEGITVRSVVSAGVGNLFSLREDRLACASPISQVGAIRQLSSSSSSGALRFLGRSNVTNFRDGDQVHRCRRSGSSASIVCSAKSEGTSETERRDESPFHLSAVAMPILAAVMVGAVQPNVQALEGSKIDVETDTFAAPGGGGQFSSPSAGGLQPKTDTKEDKSSVPSKGLGKAAVESVSPQLPSNPLESVTPKLPSNPFGGLLPGGKESSSANFEKNSPTPVANDGSSITQSSPFLKSGTAYAPPPKPAPPVRDEPAAPGTAPADQREGPTGNVVKTESEVVKAKTQGNAN